MEERKGGGVCGLTRQRTTTRGATPFRTDGTDHQCDNADAMLQWRALLYLNAAKNQRPILSRSRRQVPFATCICVPRGDHELYQMACLGR